MNTSDEMQLDVIILKTKTVSTSKCWLCTIEGMWQKTDEIAQYGFQKLISR
jgi:hypothetical protein